MTEWIAALADLAAAGRPAVLVTVLRAAGSTPRDAGTKMVVADDGFHGSIGGGHLELVALETARELLLAAARGEDVSAPVVREITLGASLGQCCGGAATLVFEAVLPVRWHVAVFGAGHVGKALVKLLADLPCAVTWIDSRAEEFPPETVHPERSDAGTASRSRGGRVRTIVSETPADEVADLPPGSDVLVMTHSHALDFEIVEAAMRRGDHRYLGLIGSRTKRARFLQRLAARGRSPEQLARLTCPVGVAGISGKHPAEIAIAVAAQLLQLGSAAARGEPGAAPAGAQDAETAR
jgi:xanthine dehydrogenase accessory factor